MRPPSTAAPNRSSHRGLAAWLARDSRFTTTSKASSRHFADEIQPAIHILLVDPGKHFVHQKLLAVHGARAPVSRVTRRPQPLEVAHHVACNSGMDIGALRRERRPRHSPSDRLRQIIRRGPAQRLVNVRQVFAVEFVEVAIVRRVVLRSVPPVPVAALADQYLFKRQLALFLGCVRGRLLHRNCARDTGSPRPCCPPALQSKR